MKKRNIFFILLFCLNCMSVDIMLAQEVNHNIIKTVASNFFESKFNKTKVQVNNIIDYKIDNKAYVSIVNFRDGGWVIVSKDNRFEPILGFNSQGSLSISHKGNADDIENDHRELFLDLFANQVKAISKSSIPNEKWNLLLRKKNHLSTRNTPVMPLLETSWGGQGAYSVTFTSAGNMCAPIAVAQIVKYWEYPYQPHGQINGEQNGPTINYDDNCPFDYDLMPYTLVDRNNCSPDWTTWFDLYPGGPEEVAVSELIYSSAFITSYRWTQGSSYYNNSTYKSRLTSYFGYSTASQVVSISENSSNQAHENFKQSLRQSLDNNSPILFSYFDGSWNHGHTFVLDGYQGGFSGNNYNFFHCVLGQGDGCDDGWFYLFASDNDGSHDQLNYFGHFGAIVNLEPAYLPEFMKNDYTIQSGTNIVWSVDKNNVNSITIENGATLTITSNVEMQCDAGIIVKEGGKLIVNGGKITCSKDTWKGIRVVGGSYPFDVKFTNGAIIENTSSTAVSMNPPLPWPEKTNHGNGILHADHTTFNNVWRMLELYAYHPSSNSSYVKHCTQNGGKYGITNWNCYHIEVEDSKFFNIQKDCIGTSDGSFSILRNEFHGGTRDIYLSNTSAGLGSTIRDNDFYCNNRNIICSGSSINTNKISLNEFHREYAYKNIELLGSNRYDINWNIFKGFYGVYAKSTGSYFNNKIRSNSFENTNYGIFTRYGNSGLKFLANCFNSIYSDIRIYNSVNINQGWTNHPANNCFTHDGNSSSSVEPFSGNPNWFRYYEPNDWQIDCRDAINSPSNVHRIKSGPSTLAICPSGGGSSSSFQFSSNKIEESIIEGDYKLARQLIGSENIEDKEGFLFATYLMENDFIEADKFISRLDKSSDKSLKPFIDIQKINLKRIKSGFTYKPSDLELNLLTKIALGESIYSGTSNALYFAFTGEFLDVNDDDLDLGKKNENSSNVLDSQPDIYPNPATDAFTIKFDDISDVDITLYDYRGTSVWTKKGKDKEFVINTRSFQKGLYYIKILRNGNLFTSTIFIN